MRRVRMMGAALALALVAGGALPAAQAGSTEPLPVDVKALAKLYAPTPDLADLDNWKTYNAYNAVYHVAENLPHRQPNDTTSTDPHGDPNAACRVHGRQCAYNHQLEYLQWFEEAYSAVLGDYGVTFRTYEFNSPGSSLGGFATNSGRALNKFAIVPGADNPEDIVMIGSHYDGVDGSPYSAWDATAGSGTLLRTAKVLTDYWRATGTRPSKTYIFAAWDAEEAGGVGSKHWVANGLPKDPEAALTLYVNHDPCGGFYPALYRGVPVGRNPLVEKTGFIPANIALHVPFGSAAKKAHMTAFNNSVPGLISALFEEIDDTLPLVTPVNDTPAEIPVFISKAEATAEYGVAQLEQESVLNVNTKGLMLFTTDAEDFPRDVPTLNPYPDNVGPHALSTDPRDIGYGPDGLWAYHSPHDNFAQLVAQTSVDQTGQTYSKGLAMSWEFCALFSALAMLQPAQGGVQTVTDEVVAYFETPKPNASGLMTFDASGSYRYTDVQTLARRSGDDLEYAWDFGDGTTGTGRVVQHTMSGVRTVTLTVTDPTTGQSDAMQLRIGTP